MQRERLDSVINNKQIDKNSRTAEKVGYDREHLNETADSK